MNSFMPLLGNLDETENSLEDTCSLKYNRETDSYISIGEILFGSKSLPQGNL